MNGVKRAAPDTLPVDRDFKQARTVAACSEAVNGDSSTLGRRWLSIGADLWYLTVDTASQLLGQSETEESILPTTMEKTKDAPSNGDVIPAASSSRRRGDMGPPPLPPPPPPRSYTVSTDAASTSTSATSPPLSDATAPSSRMTTPSSSAASESQLLPNPDKRPPRQHIFKRQHTAQLRKTREQEKESVIDEFYELKKASGYKSDKRTFKEYLNYRQRLMLLDKRGVLSPSPSMDDLRSDKTSTPSLRRSQSLSGASEYSGDAGLDFVREALATAKASMNEPRPPKPYAPSYDDLLEQRRLKDERINQRLRPKAVPLPTSLPPADDAEVTALLKKSGVIAKVARETVSSSDIARLRPGQWLNDEIINFYGALITARAEEKDKKESPRGKPLSVHCFTTFFWPKLCDDGYEQGRLAKWTKKIDLFSKDVVLIPINHGNAHWTAAAINFRRKRIESYDSMNHYTNRPFKILRKYLDDEHRNKKKQPFDFTGWEDWSLADLPQQENGFDCGVFACQFLESVSRGVERFGFTQSNIPYLRRRMIWEIAHTKLRDE